MKKYLKLIIDLLIMLFIAIFYFINRSSVLRVNCDWDGSTCIDSHKYLLIFCLFLFIIFLILFIKNLILISKDK